MGSRHSGGRLWVAVAFSAILLVGTLALAQEPTRSTSPAQGASQTYPSSGVQAPQNSLYWCERWW